MAVSLDRRLAQAADHEEPVAAPDAAGAESLELGTVEDGVAVCPGRVPPSGTGSHRPAGEDEGAELMAEPMATPLGAYLERHGPALQLALASAVVQVGREPTDQPLLALAEALADRSCVRGVTPASVAATAGSFSAHMRAHAPMLQDFLAETLAAAAEAGDDDPIGFVAHRACAKHIVSAATRRCCGPPGVAVVAVGAGLPP